MEFVAFAQLYLFPKYHLEQEQKYRMCQIVNI